MTIGIHATPKSNLERIKARGIEAVPFWRSAQPWRHPTSFRFRYDPYVNVVGDDDKRLIASVYDSLRSAKIHVDGSSRGAFPMHEIVMFLVHLESEEIIRLLRRGAVCEAVLKSPIKAIREVESVDKTYHKGVDWHSYNRILARAMAVKVREEIVRFEGSGSASASVPLEDLLRR